MTSRTPYATSQDETAPSSLRRESATSTAPWEKDQAPRNPKKGAGQVKSPAKLAAEGAPYGTSDNSSIGSRSSVSAKSAPYGTSDNAPDRPAAPKAPATSLPFGTAADGRTMSKAPAARLASPWERDESKYTHRGKGPSSDGVAPYATEKNAAMSASRASTSNFFQCTSFV